MKFCEKCGAKMDDSAMFCVECGAKLNDTTDTSFNYGSFSETKEQTTADQVTTEIAEPSVKSDNTEDKYTYTYSSETKTHASYSYVQPGIAPRNIVLAIVLSFVTCGIYQIYWMIKMNDEVNSLANEPEATNGVLVFLFTLITCGIYGFYWSYKMGERCDKIKGSVGGSSAILYLILSILGLGIVTYCLIQDTINKAV